MSEPSLPEGTLSCGKFENSSTLIVYYSSSLGELLVGDVSVHRDMLCQMEMIDVLEAALLRYSVINMNAVRLDQRLTAKVW
jgi:hypothetical protein